DLLRILGVFPAGDAYRDVDLVISDIRLPGISGLDVLKACGYISGAPPIILITAFGADWIHVEAEKLGAVDMVDKPFDIDDFVVRVGKFFSRS
ncbi:MAG: response regulator, partial [bacterium]